MLNRSAWAPIACVGIMAAASVGQAAREVVAHYTFDEGRGQVLVDHSGCGNHGQIHGAKWTKLAQGYALRFDGTDDYVNCGNNKSLDVARHGTLAFWIKPAAFHGGLMCRHTGSSWDDERMVIAFMHYVTDNSILGVLSDGNFVYRVKWAPPAAGEWTQVALSFDGKTCRQYRDGSMLGEHNQDGMVPDCGGAPLLLGQSCGLGPPHYQGLMDEVTVYRRALTPAEVFASFALEAVKKGVEVPEGTGRLSVRVETDLEGGTVTVKVDTREVRPAPDDVQIEATVEGTEMRRTVGLDANRWTYSLVFEDVELADGEYTARVRLVDGGKGAVSAGEPARAGFRWRRLRHMPDPERVLADGARSENPLYIVQDGEAAATVVVPVQANEWTTKAAAWLVAYVKRSTGAELVVMSEDAAPKGSLISVGHTRLMKDAGLTTEGLRYDGARMVVRGRTLFLFGRDELAFHVEGARGTCKAVLTFLEEAVGVRWLLPGSEGTWIPQHAQVLVGSDFDRVFNPAFGYSHGRRPYGLWTEGAIANQFRIAVKVKSYGGHSYYRWVPEKTLFQCHPELFALIDGKRTGRHNHLCSTNREVARTLLREIRKEFDRGYDWVALGQEDGYARCQCPACEGMDKYRGMTTPETPCERVIELHAWIARECAKSHPDKTVHMIVYGPTVWPSRQIRHYGDNVVAEMCVQTPEVVEAWKGKVRAMTAYVYWFDITLLRGMGVHATPKEVARKIRFMHEQGFVGLYQIPETNWGLQGPAYYVLGKLMGDPYLDYRELQREYSRGVFGPAGETMDRFFTQTYSMPEVHGRIWPEATLKRLEMLLDEAETHVRTARERSWLRLTRDHFEYSRNLSQMLAAYNAYNANSSDATWEAVRQAVEQFDSFRDRILRYTKEQTGQYFPGHDHLCRFLAGKYVGYRQSYRARREEVLRKGTRGTRVGWGRAGVALPLTLDLTKPPPHGMEQ